MGTSTTINIEQIMEEIRADIAKKGYVDDAVSFDSIEIKESVAIHNDPDNNATDFHELSQILLSLEYWCKDTKRLQEINYYRPIQSQRKIIGGLITFFKKTARRSLRFLFEPIVSEQNAFNSSVSATVQYMSDSTASAFRFMEATVQMLNTTRNELSTTKQELSATEQDLSTTKHELSAVKQELNATRQELSTTKHELDTTGQALERTNHFLNNEKAELKAAVNEMYAQIDNSELQVVRALKNYAGPPSTAGTTKVPESTTLSDIGDTYSTIDYFDFENHFRGTRYNIRKYQGDYISHFKKDGKVIDLGCGRGEFLELLKKSKFDYIGVDLYDEFVAYCQMKGLNAVKYDAVKYLLELENESVSGIFSAHLVEHLETSQLVSLCRRSYEVLKPGGCLILETPNPMCIGLFKTFHIDPSHIKPVHPLTLEYLLGQAGFEEIETIFTEYSKINYELPHLKGDNIHNLDAFNEGIANLSNTLYGSLDYAIIAKKQKK